MKPLVSAVCLVVIAAASARAQEVSVYAAALDGNLRNVLQFGYGGGASFTALVHARAGVRVDAGFYEAREHYTAPLCVPGGTQPCLTGSEVVTSRTPFNMQDAMVVVAPLLAEGARLYVGAGISRFSLSNDQIGDRTDSTYSAKQSATGTGPVFMVSIVGRPQWRYHFAGEAMLTYHRTGQLRSCSAGESPPQQPFCGSLGVTELRLGLVYAPRWAR